MYICSECKKEYNIKPDYCDDCGNDTFIEKIEEQSVSEDKNIQHFEPELKPEENKIPKTAAKKEIKKEIKQEEIISYVIFLICIILSFVVLSVKVPEKNQEKVAANPETKMIDIPPIDSIWNSEAPKSTKTENNIQTPIIKNTEVILPKIEPKKTETAQIKNINQKEPKKTVVPLFKFNTNKSQTSNQVKKQTQKPVQKTVNKSATQPKIQTTPQVKTTPKVKSVAQTQKPVQNNQPKPAANTQSAQPVWNYNQTATTQTQANTAPVIDRTPALKKEWSSYKTSLRNTIGRKIDFADVVGDGNCAVSFKIDSSGKLINKAFVKQSTNTTLNDTVYKAIMATPSYNPPPEYYKGETLNLKINFYNGNFEISLN